MPVPDGDLAVPASPAAADPSGAWHQRVPEAACMLSGLPDDQADLLWPSQVWRTHLADCDAPPRKCDHDVPLPDWWWDVVKRSRMPLHTDPTQAVRLAMGICTRFKGGPKVSPEGVEFARDAVRDALPVAPQPVSREWVRSSLATISNLATWIHDEGEPLDREHIFNEQTIHRWLYGPSSVPNLDERSRGTYRSRVERIATLLLQTPRVHFATPPPPPKHPIQPLTQQEEADLWAWSEGLRPQTRRAALQTYMALCLGFGTHRRDAIRVTGNHLYRNDLGVHVDLPATTSGAGHLPARTVTCRADWEDRIWALREAMDNLDNQILFPHRSDRFVPPNRIDILVAAVHASAAAPPPRRFSSEGLRNTWILRHLEAGTPLHVLMRHGGLIATNALVQLVPYMAPVDDATAQAMLRAPGGHLT